MTTPSMGMLRISPTSMKVLEWTLLLCPNSLCITSSKITCSPSAARNAAFLPLQRPSPTFTMFSYLLKMSGGKDEFTIVWRDGETLLLKYFWSNIKWTDYDVSTKHSAYSYYQRACNNKLTYSLHSLQNVCITFYGNWLR